MAESLQDLELKIQEFEAKLQTTTHPDAQNNLIALLVELRKQANPLRLLRQGTDSGKEYTDQATSTTGKEYTDQATSPTGLSLLSEEAGKTLIGPEERLKDRTAPEPAFKFLDHLVTHYAPQLLFATNTKLRELYDAVALAPHTSTRTYLRTSDNITFNGLYGNTFSSRSALVMAFKDEIKPVLVKFTQQPADAVREYTMLKNLWEAGLRGIVGPVTLMNTRGGSIMNSPGAHALEAKKGICMPIYAATLHHAHPLSEGRLLDIGKQLKTTLDDVHEQGLGHNDVKPTNIFLSNEGQCVLGDFGSAQALGTRAQEFTEMYSPKEFERLDLSVEVTSKAVDYFQLVMTLLLASDKCTGASIDPNPRAVRAALPRLTNSGLVQLIEELLQPQAFGLG